MISLLRLAKKILYIILFWSRFRFSLCGRISIVKTLIIPQLNYLGCILTPSRLVLDNIQEMIDDFALNGLKINKSRYYLPLVEGGVGLIHIGTFLMAQKCSWIKRTHTNTIDNWRLRLRFGCPNFDVTLLKKCDFNPDSEPILSNISGAFELFINCFSKISTNYKTAPIFANTSFFRSKDNNRLLDAEFFGKAFYAVNKGIIRKLTYADCFLETGFRTIAEFGEIGLELTVSLWMKLRSAMLLAKKKLSGS
jgi:hypothetical protein